jgi:hypothetical protein
MKVEYVSEHDLSSAKVATGRALDEWFQELDAMGGIGKGRRSWALVS